MSRHGKQPSKVVILDFDGTVADTMPLLEEIAVKLITKNYRKDRESARKGYIRTTGLPFWQQLEILFPNDPLNNEIAAKFEEEKKNRFFDQPLFADAVETIEQLRQKFLVCVSSSTLQPLVEQYCQENKLIVDCILGYRLDFEKGKDHFDYVVKKYGLTYSDLVYVGDSLNDAKRAQYNHVAFIGKVGLFSKQEFQELGNIPTITFLKELVVWSWNNMRGK
ncbi:MAG: HAD family hydrolase [Candidatus Heimdallarchaeota archaeon]